MPGRISYREALLMKRMALHNIRRCENSTPSKEDERYVPVAVQMLLCIAVLDYVLLDLEEELTAAGLFRHEVKHRVRRAQELSLKVHGEAYRALHGVAPSAGHQYNGRLDDAYRKIQAGVLLEAPERSYNLAVALCRQIGRLNRELTGRYDFAPARALGSIPSLLSCCGVKDYRIDYIVELSSE